MGEDAAAFWQRLSARCTCVCVCVAAATTAATLNSRHNKHKQHIAKTLDRYSTHTHTRTHSAAAVAAASGGSVSRPLPAALLAVAVRSVAFQLEFCCFEHLPFRKRNAKLPKKQN